MISSILGKLLPKPPKQSASKIQHESALGRETFVRLLEDLARNPKILISCTLADGSGVALSRVDAVKGNFVVLIEQQGSKHHFVSLSNIAVFDITRNLGDFRADRFYEVKRG